METASLFIQKEGVVLSGTMSHLTESDTRKALLTKGRGIYLIDDNLVLIRSVVSKVYLLFST